MGRRGGETRGDGGKREVRGGDVSDEKETGDEREKKGGKET